MATCIDPQFVERIKSLNLASMKTADRIKAFNEILGEGTGRDINLLYEKSLLLKNKQLDRFIDDISGKSIEKKAKIKENMAKRLAEKQGIIDDEELLSIAKETLDKKYGLDIDIPETEKIFKIRKEADKLSKLAQGTPDGSEAKLKWGEKLVDLSDEIGKLKEMGTGVLNEFKLAGQRITGKVKDKEYVATVGQFLEETIKVTFSPAFKSIKASWDNSVILRQGLKVFSANPKIWKNRSADTFKVWAKVFNKEAMEQASRAFKADLVTRDLYQAAIKSKLAIGVVEDFFPTSIVQKIPGLGNVFKASDEAFTIFSQGARMDLFESYVKLFRQANGGAMPTDDILKQFAKIANSTTGRGGLSRAEATSGLLNQLFFSARFQTANINTVRHAFIMTGPAGKIARKQLARHIALIGGIMTTMSMFTDVGFNPEESTFGKARIPGTKKWVDINGGLLSYITAGVKAIQKAKGKQTYGQDSGMDVLVNFLKGKLAPGPGMVRDWLEQRNFDGEKPTVWSSAKSLFVPISAENVYKNVKEDEIATVTALEALLETFGAGTSEPKSRGEGSYRGPIDWITGN